MKKITKILCLTLAMLMVMSTGVWAETTTAQDVSYKQVPVYESFNDYYTNNTTVAGNLFSNYYDATKISGLSAFERNTSNTRFNKVNVTSVSGIGGKEINDHSVTFVQSSTYTQSSFGRAIVKYGPYESIPLEGVHTIEFDYLRLGDNAGKIMSTLSATGKDDVNTDIVAVYDIEGEKVYKLSSSFTLEEGKEDFTYPENQWVHIAVEYYTSKYDNADLKNDIIVYVNGEKIGEISGNSSTGKGYVRNDVTKSVLKFYCDVYNSNASGRGYVIDNLKFTNTQASSFTNAEAVKTEFAPEEITITGTEINNIPFGTTVAEIKEMISENDSEGKIKIYDDYSTMNAIVPATNATDLTSKEKKDGETLSTGDILVAENKAANGYAYYEIKIADGLLAKQNGAALTEGSSFDLESEITFSYAATNANESRVLLVGVYNAAGDLVDVVMNEDGVVPFGEGQETITATVPAASLTGLTDDAKVNAFVWKDLADIVPTGEEITLTYDAQ